ncbi:serine acetyltransferase [Limosilactobacillus fermentum]|uniref:serine acetyltransferase n=1 Tax=Limosilactobacillus fermentum TaxID=1613 RepID=UPI00128E6A18|nr:serine acetyltransferase [Limosilactobacillus fermentum]MPW03850.1 hypothetical protein [Limosilactobacillus fermentum]
MEIIKELKSNPGLLPKIVILVYRFGNFTVYKVKLPVVKQLLYIVYRIIDLFFLKMLFNDDIPAEFKAGWGFKIYHPYGIFINAGSIVGDNFTCRGQVTIGNKGVKSKKCPHIGNDVEIGVGARIIGDVSIGNGCIIGANSVVTRSFGKSKILVGIPAREIRVRE